MFYLPVAAAAPRFAYFEQMPWRVKSGAGAGYRPADGPLRPGEAAVIGQAGATANL
jgi:hypothetical protein